MSTPQLTLPDREIAQLFSEKQPDSLASLIKTSQPQPETLNTVLSATINQFFLQSFAHRTQIDEHISFLSAATGQVQSGVFHPGQEGAVGEHGINLRPANGPEVLVERLSHSLAQIMWDQVSRFVTPDEDYDRNRSKKYYADTSVHATILARAFATQPSFRDRLWREVEDIFVKGLFSGPEQEPGIFVAMAALLLGAGAEIQEYLSQEGKVGQGMDWLWYDNIRTGSYIEWGWGEVEEQVKNQPGSEMLDRIPEYIKTSFETAKEHVRSGFRDSSWDSKKLAEQAFAWASEF